jgi:hypothetical protein
MLLRAGIGFALLVGIVALGAWVSQQRAKGSGRLLPRLAGQVHRTVGVVAVALLVMLAVTALRLSR